VNPTRNDIAITYPVERRLVERAVELLASQRKTTSRFYKFLVRASIAFVSVALLTIIMSVIEYSLGWTAFGVISALLVFPLLVAALAWVGAFLAGLPQLGIQWWFSRRMRKIGFADAALTPATTWRKGSLHFLGSILGALGVVALLVTAILLSVLWFDPEIGGDAGSADPGSTNTGVMDLIVLGAVGLLFTVPSFLARRRRALDLLHRSKDLEDRLARALAEQAPGDEVAIRAQDLNLMASIERARIEREREEAISMAGMQRDEFVLLYAREAVEKMRTLDPETRMRVEEEASELTESARRAAARQDEHSGLLQIRVPDTDLQLNCSVDEMKKQVRLVSVTDV